MKIEDQWNIYAEKIGLTKDSDVNMVSDLKQTFYAGQMGLLALLELRGIDLSEAQDILMDMVQFSKSQVKEDLQ